MDKRDIRRKFGQNYLSDPAIIFEMGQSVSPYSGDQFLEVGPGELITEVQKCLRVGDRGSRFRQINSRLPERYRVA